ncbi:MAG: radical SAM protein [Candidatus Omnitrophica bacterium]|nr:radical SAM protein [Candidatus Omnitrophota bacterium]
MKIGHIDDDNIIGAIRNFYNKCSCERFNLIKGAADEKINISLLNIEFSLQCQGKCALCCVNAPSWKGYYNCYDSLTKMVEILNPEKILAQGGEVLIQKKSLDWLNAIKNHHPEIKLLLVSNCNVDCSLIEEVEKLFNEVWVSFMAFQDETYERIMGMNVKKTIEFVEKLARNGKTRVVLKFLITPLSIHEVSQFLEWALNLNPFLIYIEDGSTEKYINLKTSDKFWEKISQRSGLKVKMFLVKNKRKLLDGSTMIKFTNKSLRILSLNDGWKNFLRINGLQDKVTIFWA